MLHPVTGEDAAVGCAHQEAQFFLVFLLVVRMHFRLHLFLDDFFDRIAEHVLDCRINEQGFVMLVRDQEHVLCHMDDRFKARDVGPGMANRRDIDQQHARQQDRQHADEQNLEQ